MRYINKIVFAFLAMTTYGIAADIPAKTEAPIPILAQVAGSTNDFYVGARFGSVAAKVTPWYGNLYGGVNAGYEFSEYARVEVNYDYAHSTDKNFRSHLFTSNLIGQYRLGFVPVVPYVLAGGGYRMNNFKNETIWNVGGGVRYEFMPSLEFDLRYRYIANFDRKNSSNVVTLGANYKF